MAAPAGSLTGAGHWPAQRRRSIPCHPVPLPSGPPDAAGQPQPGGGLLFGGGDEDGGGEGGCSVTDGEGDGDGDGEGEGDGDADGDGFGEGLGDGLPDRLGFVEDEDDVAGSRIGGLDVASAVGHVEDLAALGEGFGEDSWSEICCTAATEWADVRGPGPLRASAVLAATTAPTPTAMATRSPVIRRNTEI